MPGSLQDDFHEQKTLSTSSRGTNEEELKSSTIKEHEVNLTTLSDRLDLDEVMSQLGSPNMDKIISNETYIGHLHHLYANNVANPNSFIKNWALSLSKNYRNSCTQTLEPEAPYKHRIPMNSWHGE